MLKLGNWNELVIVRFTDHGAYLDGGDVGEVLMPKSYDQSERLVATTEQPRAVVGQFACLRVSWVNEYGAFLDWGLMKDLFVPFREQKTKMEQGRSYVVYIYIDESTRRIVGTAKVDRYLTPASSADYYRGKDVELLVQGRTPLGFKVIVDNAHAGLVYDNQIYGQTPRMGERWSHCVPMANLTFLWSASEKVVSAILPMCCSTSWKPTAAPFLTPTAVRPKK